MAREFGTIYIQEKAKLLPEDELVLTTFADSSGRTGSKEGHFKTFSYTDGKTHQKLLNFLFSEGKDYIVFIDKAVLEPRKMRS